MLAANRSLIVYEKPGDIGFVPAGYGAAFYETRVHRALMLTATPTGHYVENIGNETLHYLEIFNSGRWKRRYRPPDTKTHPRSCGGCQPQPGAFFSPLMACH